MKLSIPVFQCVLGLAIALGGQAAHAGLHDRGNGMIYDDDLNVTFLANANYAKVQGLGVNGRLTQEQAYQFVDQLVYAGYDDWRLPTGAFCDGRWPPTCGGELNHLIHAEIRPTFRADLLSPWDQVVPIYCSPIVRTESGDDNAPQNSSPSAWNNCANTWMDHPGGIVPPDAAPLFTVANCDTQLEPCLFWIHVPNAGDQRWIMVYDGRVSTNNANEPVFVWAVRDGDVLPPADGDHDGVTDAADNCPALSNPNQTDNDHDGQGDACDADDDNDLVLDGADNCPLVANADQRDVDRDGLGDPCDGDLDGDGFINAADNCPTASNLDQTDTDRDGSGDECDLNDDNDAFADASDNCPTVANDDQGDLDADGIGDLCDADLDGDGTANQADNCPLDANTGQDDADNDGDGDACDNDDDNDSIADAADNCPLMANPSQSDQDRDGLGDACDSDADGDGAGNASDNCPALANPDQRDFDRDGTGDACDSDIDGDGVANIGDRCPNSTASEVVDSTGCSIAQLSPCSGPAGTVMRWPNNGKYVSSVAHSANLFRQAGLITDAQKSAIVSTAANSTCGK